jgi:hypothetical protein
MSVEPYHRRKWFLVRCTARPEQEKLNAEGEAKPKRAESGSRRLERADKPPKAAG